MSGAIYSNAFNFGSYMNGSVDPRTGQYSVSLHLAQIRPPNLDGLSRDVKLAFSALSTVNRGFGIGWSMSVCSLDLANGRNELTLSDGRTFQGNVLPPDGGDFSFKDQKLKDFRVIKVDNSTFDVVTKDGVVERLARRGSEPVARVSLLRFPSGEAFQFQYDYQANGVSYLTKVVFSQTGETVLEIAYAGLAAHTVSYPVDHGKTAKILLRYQNNLLTSVTLPYDGSQSVGDGSALPKYTISYGLRLGIYQVVERLRSPTGGLENLQYTEQGHRLNGGGYIPFVRSHELRPGRNQPSTTKTYSFSQDRNFLGYGSGTFVEGEDNLYLVYGAYNYESTESVSDGTTTIVSKARTFNKFHLLTREVKTQDGTQTTTSITYHEQPALQFHQQPANFQSPRVTVTQYKNLQTSALRQETVTTEADDYGNTLSTLDVTGVKTTYEYYSAGGEAQRCPADPFGFVRYVRRLTVTPAAGSKGSAVAKTTDYTYAETSTIGQTPARYYVNKATETLNSGVYKTFAYHDTPATHATHGLLREVRSRQNNKTTVMAFAHVVQSGATTTTTTTTGFDGATATSRTTRSRLTSHIWQETDVVGVTTTSTYDVMGRLVEQAASGVRRRYVYEYPVGDATSGWPMMREIDPKGVSKKIHYDGMGRVCLEEAQDDDREPSTSGGDYQGTYRLVTEKRYDVINQLVSEKRYDYLWNAGQTARVAPSTVNETTFEYDGWGKVRRMRFPDGHAELSIHDPVAMTMKKGIEGEGSSLAVLDLFENPVTVTQRHANGATQATWQNEYDGFGRMVSEKDPSGPTTRYAYDLFDRVIERSLPDGTRVAVLYADHSADELVVGYTVSNTSFGTRSYDGLGRVRSESVGGRTSSYAYEGGGDKPSRVTTPGGRVLEMRYAHPLGSRLVSLSGSGADMKYQYDPATAALVRAESGDFVEDRRYFASGLARSASEQPVARLGRSGATTTHAYSMSGQLQTILDGLGDTHTREYEARGRLKSCQQGSRKATFEYDGKSRPASLRVEDTAAGASLTTSLTYDDFGREIRRVVSGRSTRSIETVYLVNGQIGRRITTDGGVVVRDETYTYDTRSRLKEYQCAGSQPPRDASGRAVLSQRFFYDVWSNVTRRETAFADGQEVAIYRFSDQDPTQLASVERNGQTVRLAYDVAGNLTRDEQGRELQYDSQNRLSRVLDKNGQVLSDYHYDAMGKLVGQSLPGGVQALRYYQGEIVSNQTLGDRKITYLGVDGQYFAENERQGSGSRGHLFVTDDRNSLVASAEVGGAGTEDFRYTPHGERSASGEGARLIGWNGESVDPVTGWYFLGNGYRVYNPALMRFHSPDNWSPFGQGGMNPYVYSAGDPINRTDPSGHLSTGAWVSIGLGTAGILIGIFTLGVGAAVGAGLIASASVIGAMGTTSALAVTGTVIGIASSAVGIASAALEENEQASSILGWVSLGLGIAGGVAGVTELAMNAKNIASASSAISNVTKVSRSEIFWGLGVSGTASVFDVVSVGTGLGAAIANETGNSDLGSTLGWVSRGFGAASLATNMSQLARPSRAGRYDLQGSKQSPSGARASSSEPVLVGVRPLRDDSVFRVSSDRINNAYNMLPPMPFGIFRQAQFDVDSLFVTRL